MQKLLTIKLLTLLSMLLISSTDVYAITVEQLAQQFETYKQQQAVEISQIRQENAKLKAENKVLLEKFEQTQQQVENNTVAVETVSETYETGSQSSGWWDRTTVGGYGELHYNNREIDGVGTQQEIDFHRFVLFFGHEFTEQLHFFSELELEHAIAGDGKNGEIELEQAFLEYDYADWGAVKAGLFLIPVGIINETHEPGTFYGVERNEVEKRIIPSTWWEAGIATNVHFDNGISVDLAVTSGLKLDEKYSIRSGRGKVSEQDATEPALITRVKYTGVPGLELASTVIHQPDMAQSDNSVPIGSGTLYEAHVIYSHAVGPGILTGKALYSRWDINVPNNNAAANQYGWYVEPSYRFPVSMGELGFYGRFQSLEYYSGSAKKASIWEAGANWWIHENVVLKGNYIYTDKQDGSPNETGFDLGIGYQF
jgi:hypothetical protein